MTRYFNRLANRTGLTVAGKPHGGTEALSDKQMPASRIPESVPSARMIASTDITNTNIEVHEEGEAISHPAAAESALTQESKPSILAAVAEPAAPTFENGSQLAARLSAGESFKPSTTMDMGSLRPESAGQHTVLESTVQPQDMAPGGIEPANTIQRQTTTDVPQGQATPEKTIESPAAKTGGAFQAGFSVRENRQNHTGITTGDLEQHAAKQAMPTIAEPAETPNNILEQSGRPGRRIQLNDPGNVIEQRTIKGSQEEINVKNTVIKQEFFSSHNTTRNSFATQIVKQPPPVNTRPSSKNNIEIKIGKIDLEVHQPVSSPATMAPRPIVRQQTATPQGNNLSRYYLRGF